jgi:hypothetical protein
MSAASTIILLMAAQQQHQRMMEEQARRRREEERRRRERLEEERRRDEEHRKMVEHRKNSAVVYNDENWQQDRCVKAISLQPSVQNFMGVIEKVRPTIIKEEAEKFDERILETGYAYEKTKIDLDSDIEALKESGISIQGTQYELTRLTPTNTLVAKIERITEYEGTTFTINNGQPIELNPIILSSDSYFKDRYQEMHPEEVTEDYATTTTRLKRYQSIGKYLGFLLKTKKYSELVDHSEKITAKHDKCELRKREMESFQSLTKEQLLMIRSYFEHLQTLSSISDNIKDLFYKKRELQSDSNKRIYDLTIKRILSSEEYSELVSQIKDYINRIHSNDEETMQKAYELVKGEYPINISRRFIYDLIIDNIKKYKKEDIKTLKLS